MLPKVLSTCVAVIGLTLVMPYTAKAAPELSRAKAVALIKSSGGIEARARVNYETSSRSGYRIADIQWMKEKETYQLLENAGLVYKKECIGGACFDFSDNGRKYVKAPIGGSLHGACDVLLASPSKIMVTGIRTNSGRANADIIVKLEKTTPFGEALCKGDLKGYASFILYDDGWRLQSYKVKNGDVCAAAKEQVE